MKCKEQTIQVQVWQEEAGACVVNFCKQLMDAARQSSCGKCVLCREGTWQAYQVMADITEGKGCSEDYELLLEILTQISCYANCQFSKSSALQCLELMKTYESEWEKHLLRKRCVPLVCKCSYTLYVDSQLCQGCGTCKSICPRGAIRGEAQMIHLIQAEQCDKCMDCMNQCPSKAIKKAGEIKPKIPSELMPVGTFNQVAEETGDGGMRRRRRRG